MSRGSYYKRIDANRRKNFQSWRVITERRINDLNTLTGEKHAYALAYRGRNHRLVLIDCSKTLASGMVNINQVLDLLEARYEKAINPNSEN